MKVSISRGISSIFGPGLTIEGNVTSKGDVYVLGAFTGTVNAHKLTIEKSGAIDGNVEAESVVIDGSFSGNLTATSVSLGRTASVNADIVYVSMEMQSGAVHCGAARHVDIIEATAANGLDRVNLDGHTSSSPRPEKSGRWHMPQAKKDQTAAEDR
jgi:cytoskeletal protein CcmA (bactofilin family)